MGIIDYKACWDYQHSLFNKVMQRKLEKRHLHTMIAADVGEMEEKKPVRHYFLFCEHPPVFTLGTNGKMQHLLLNEAHLKQKGIAFYKINRGGDITFHGQGQIIGYPIFDMDYFFTDMHKFLRYLEEAVIQTLKEYGIQAGRLAAATGVWLDADIPSKARKICAIGIRCSRWITMHGFALNVNTDLNYFNYIIPCGINDRSVTSLEKELGQKISMDKVKNKLKKHFCELFEIEFSDQSILGKHEKN